MRVALPILLLLPTPSMSLLSRLSSTTFRRFSSTRLFSTGTSLPPLPSGATHPSIGYGTYKVGFIPSSAASAVAGDTQEITDTKTTVLLALNLGYRFLDCAEYYGNEAGVGDAIAEWGGDRSELFVASKVWTTTIEGGRGDVRAQVERSIADLGVGYLDLCCVHWPVPGHHVTAFSALVDCKYEGLVRDVGLSNYAVEDYLEIPPDLRGHIGVNQIEVNPFLYRKETIDYFQERNIVVQSYRSLRDGKEFSNSALLQVAEKHGTSAAQVLGRWCLQKGCVYIPKSVSVDRMSENMDVESFELDEGDMKVLDGLTTDEALEKMLASYKIGVVRDTSLEGRHGVGVKDTITH